MHIQYVVRYSDMAHTHTHTPTTQQHEHQPTTHTQKSVNNIQGICIMLGMFVGAGGGGERYQTPARRNSMFKLRRFQGVLQRRTCIYVYTCAHVHSIHNLHLFVCQRARTQYPHARHTRTTTTTTTRRSAGLGEHCNAPSTVACLGNHVPGTCVG